ncbi:MAG: PilZ domain-containing protein [Polyangiaceae bacterium]
MADEAEGDEDTARAITERRRDPRVPIDKVVVSFKGGTPKRYRIVDLSLGGVRLAHGKSPVPNDVHTLELEFGGDKTLRVLAKTVWRDDAEHAVSFLALNDMDRLLIAELIDELRSRRA